MTIEQIREKILSDDAFVLAELRQVQYLYGLQRVIRSNLTRNEEINTESVADHIYALNVLADYFCRVEPLPQLNLMRVRVLITWHDIDEIETGDTVGFLKTTTHQQAEAEVIATVIAQAPTILQSSIQSCLEEYKAQVTLEAQFVKALDKIEPIFYFLNENGKKVFAASPATKEQHCRIKEPYIQKFQYIKRFHEVTLPIFERDGYLATNNQ
jgi:5'-deoxynucleotidase YfbR-like HD superfamily hydrolase